jgi:hypothetical protein
MEIGKEEQLILKSLRWKGKSLAKSVQDSSQLHTDSLNGMFLMFLWLFPCHNIQIVIL